LRHESWLLNALRLFVAGLGSGYLPKAPGTWGSLASLPVAYVVLDAWGVMGLLYAALGLWLLGCWACMPVLKTMEEQDPGWIVIDEWVGQWLCLWVLLLFYPSSWFVGVLSFVAFRLFDIWKPFPIRQLEHWGAAWWSIMLDDVVAGLMGGSVMVVLWGVYHGVV